MVRAGKSHSKNFAADLQVRMIAAIISFTSDFPMGSNVQNVGVKNTILSKAAISASANSVAGKPPLRLGR